MLTRPALALLTLATFLFVVAFATGSLILLTLGLFPLAVLFLGGAGAAPRRIAVTLELPERAVRLGEQVPVTVRYEVRGGRGVLELHQPIPGPFDLTAGSNLHVVAKGAGTLVGAYRFTVRATRRGEHSFGPVDWEHLAALGFTGSRTGKAGAGGALHVRPTLHSVRRIPRTRSKGRLVAAEAEIARQGVAGNEFRDIRQYQRGDAPKTINWKATARADRRRRRPAATDAQRNGPPYPPPDRLVPLVNEYEPEGQQHAWIYLDCGPHMRLGTSAMNAFEAAVTATIAVAQHLLVRGHRVGLTLYNQREPVHLYPDVGRRQLFVIQGALAHAEPSDTTGGLAGAVLETKRFLVAARHRITVITRSEADHPALLDGLRLLRRLAGGRRRDPGILVLGIDPYGLLPERAGTAAARAVVRARHRAKQHAVARTGVNRLEWDPSATRIEEALLRRSVIA